jgi:hypothetical protein
MATTPTIDGPGLELPELKETLTTPRRSNCSSRSILFVYRPDDPEEEEKEA